MNLSPVPKEVRLFILIEQAFRIASSLQEQGRAGDADQLYQFILAVKPDHYGSLFQLATLRARSDQLDIAMELFRQAAAADPNSADAQAGLGVVLAVDGRHAEAAGFYEKALSIDANHAGAHHALGAALHALGRTEEAIPHFERSIEIMPDYAQAHFGFANLLRTINRVPEAIAHYEKVIALQPHRVEAYNHLGTALQKLGRLDEASTTYERALQIAPRQMATHLKLAYLRRFTADDARLRQMELMAADLPTLGADDQILLHFALGRAYADLNQHERSFDHLREGNAIKRRRLDYDESLILGTFERIRTIFDRDLMKRKSDSGDDSRVPVFVVGMPRSGTTLVEQILASHSQIYGAGETEAFTRAVAPFRRPEIPGGDFPEMISTMSAEDLHELGSRYVGSVRSLAPEMARIVNRLPLNFIFVGLVHLALPNARIIHVRRDPMDTCFSCYSLMFTGNAPFTYDLGELGRYYRGYAAVMEHWHEVMPKGVMIDVAYEELVDDLEGQARTMIAHCGLQWENACLAFQLTERSVGTASAVQVWTPVYRTSVGRWRHYEKFLQPLVEALNPAVPAVIPELDHASA